MLSLDERIAIIRESPLFDLQYYVESYPDVALSGSDPVEHYLEVGARLGRRPSLEFDSGAYLDRYRDVALTGQNPLVHFETWGKGEGRDPSPGPVAKPKPGGVDVVVPVYNALEDVAACLASIAAAETRFDVRVLVVNDGSDDQTTEYLRKACERLGHERARFELIEHETNKGYTVAVNTGLKASDAAYVVTLNSDTIVTPGWLDGLVDALSDTIGVTGPLSNAASWQNVPTLKADDGSGFAINALPDGMSPNEMAKLVREVSRNARPLSTFLNGFCLLIRRDVLDAVGYMDEISFPAGYGEENDFCLRAQDAGFSLAIADDVYVFHAKSKSFGHAKRTELSKKGAVAIRRKHGNSKFDAKVKAVANLSAMDVVRTRVAGAIAARTELVPENALDLIGAQKILFLLPVRGGGGGAHSVIQEAMAMTRMGVDVKIAVHDADYFNFIQIYGDIPEVHEMFIGFRPETVVATAQSFDVVVATIFSSVSLLERIAKACPWILPAYYIQDYEPMFFEPGSPDWEAACRSYTAIPGAILFAKTDWICSEVERNHGVRVHKVEPSVDHDIYKPTTTPRTRDGSLRITAMIRPQTPRRGPGRTMELLAALKQKFGSKVDVDIFGCGNSDLTAADLRQDFPFTNHGVLTRPKVAELLRTSDIFVDLSDYQAFGRTSLEAMACGTLAVLPRAGGGDEYAVHDRNALVVDSFDVATCQSLIEEVLHNRSRMSRLRFAGLQTASRYSPRRAALSELMMFAPALAEVRSQQKLPDRPRVTLLPALNGGAHLTIAGSGYVRLLCPYRQDSLVTDWNINVRHDGALPDIGSAEVAILQRDLLPGFADTFQQWAIDWKATGGRLIYEIDDDLLDAQALRDRGYKGDADALGERVRHYAEAADVITVSTPHLADILSDFDDKIILVPNYIDSWLWNLNDEAAPETSADEDRPIVVGYAGTPTHTGDLEMVQDAIKELEAEGRIRVEVVGAFQRMDPLFGKRIGLPANSVYPVFAKWLREIARWDVAIVPLCDTPFNKSKSNLKFMESAALNAAVLCSNTSEYARVVRDGDNGLLVGDTTEDWLAALRRVINDPALRRKLVRNAYLDLQQTLNVQANHDLYDHVLRRAAGLA